MTSDINPYAAPQTAEIRDKPTDDESVRREHLSHEASVQSIGSLYVIGGIFPLAAIAFVAGDSSAKIAERAVGVALLAAVAFLCGGMAYGLLWLRPWARIMGIVIAVPMVVLSFPISFLIGPLINLYVIYLLASRKGRTVFSAEYRRVINATPHVKYRSSWLLWGFLILVVTLFAVGVVAALFS